MANLKNFRSVQQSQIPNSSHPKSSQSLIMSFSNCCIFDILEPFWSITLKLLRFDPVFTACSSSRFVVSLVAPIENVILPWCFPYLLQTKGPRVELGSCVSPFLETWNCQYNQLSSIVSEALSLLFSFMYRFLFLLSLKYPVGLPKAWQLKTWRQNPPSMSLGVQSLTLTSTASF